VAQSTLASPLASRARWTLNPRRRRTLTAYLLISPWLLGFVVLTLGPMLFSLYASFTRYDIVNAPRWTGLTNYKFIFQYDPSFRTALGNTLWYVVVKTPLFVAVSLGVALLMNKKVPGVRFFRTIFYMPTVITGVAAVFLWIWVLSPTGILNRGLGALHLPQPNWFYDPSWSKPGLVIMSLWYVGGTMIILLAGLSGIPRQLYEAAEVEGAGSLRKFWSITLPMLSPTLFFIVLTSIIGAFQVFNSAYVVSTTEGSQPGDPQQSLLFYEVYIYIHFKSLDMGYASALAWILFVVILAITVLQLWLSRRWVYYEA